MAKRTTQAPTVKLTRREKALIGWDVRLKMSDRAIVKARIDTGRGTEEDVTRMEQLERDVEAALQAALEEKIKNAPPPVPKRKYQRRDPSISDQEYERQRKADRRANMDEKERKRKQREQKAAQRARKREEIGLPPVKKKRTPAEKREHERQRKAAYRTKKQKMSEKDVE